MRGEVRYFGTVRLKRDSLRCVTFTRHVNMRHWGVTLRLEKLLLELFWARFGELLFWLVLAPSAPHADELSTDLAQWHAQLIHGLTERG